MLSQFKLAVVQKPRSRYKLLIPCVTNVLNLVLRAIVDYRDIAGLSEFRVISCNEYEILVLIHEEFLHIIDVTHES